MRKTNYHRLASYLAPELFDPEIREKLDAIVAIAQRARPRTDSDQPEPGL